MNLRKKITTINGLDMGKSGKVQMWKSSTFNGHNQAFKQAPHIFRSRPRLKRQLMTIKIEPFIFTALLNVLIESYFD